MFIYLFNCLFIYLFRRAKSVLEPVYGFVDHLYKQSAYVWQDFIIKQAT